MENDTIQYQGKTIHQKHIVHFCLDCLGEDNKCEECNGIGEWESTVDLDFGYEPESLNKLYLVDIDDRSSRPRARSRCAPPPRQPCRSPPRRAAGVRP